MGMINLKVYMLCYKYTDVLVAPEGLHFSLTLVFPLPWTTTGRESYAVFLTLTRPVPNFRSTSSARNRNKRCFRAGYKN